MHSSFQGFCVSSQSFLYNLNFINQGNLILDVLQTNTDFKSCKLRIPLPFTSRDREMVV